MRVRSSRNAEDCSRPECVRVAMKDALRRSWKHLMKERLQDTKPAIPLGADFGPCPSQRALPYAAIRDRGRSPTRYIT